MGEVTSCGLKIVSIHFSLEAVLVFAMRFVVLAADYVGSCVTVNGEIWNNWHLPGPLVVWVEACKLLCFPRCLFALEKQNDLSVLGVG